MGDKNKYFTTLNFDNANLIANRICQGEPITIVGGRCSGKTTFELATMFEIYDKVLELRSRIYQQMQDKQSSQSFNGAMTGAIVGTMLKK